ncbi:MAG: ribbon-helix-helix protein, CopG family [Bryobacteraceae bacterium]
MRTTVRLDDAILVEAKKLAAETGRSLTSVIEDALREVITRRKTASKAKRKFALPTFKGRGLRPGVDLDNSAALLDAMEERS